MAFWNDALKKMQEMVQQRPQQDKQNLSNRDDGGFSGYQPKVGKNRVSQTTGPQQMTGVGGMMPPGVDPGILRGFGQGTQPVPQGTARQPQFQGNVPPQQMANPGVPPQMGGQPWQPAPQMNQAQPFNPPMPAQQPFPQSQQRPAQPPFQGTVPPQQPQAQQGMNQTFHFPGDYVTEDGGYKLVFRVAQITGVTSCFRVIEFMHNNEAVVVNAEMITDHVEATRCMDLIFGAACAFGQRLIRVSGKQIYLITPPQVRVEPFENILRAGMDDIDRRWPGARQMNMNFNVPNRPVAQGGFGAQPRQEDFVPGGRRSSRSANQGNYTDYGGFGMHR